MMKYSILGLGFLTLTACVSTTAETLDLENAITYCDRQVNRSLIELKGDKDSIDYHMMPRNIMASDNSWHCRKADKAEWCGGFWPGVLWYDYEATKNEEIRRQAEKFTASLEFLSHTPAYDHDLGFLMFCGFGSGYRLTNNPKYKQVILDTADSLATLFNPKVGTILSWPRNVSYYGGHNTIMDNMINLEMLFWAAKNGGDKKLYDIAVRHAETTMKHQFRDDYTSYHVAVYDTISGDFIKAVTHQGYADGSRGVYVPYWDFDDPAIPDAPRDASAACVVASALLELQNYVDAEKSKTYKEAATKMLTSLSSDRYACGTPNQHSSCTRWATGRQGRKSTLRSSTPTTTILKPFSG